MFEKTITDYTKTIYLYFRLSVLLILIANNCTAQDIVKDFKINDFNSISVFSGINVYLSQDSVEKVTVIGPEDLLKDIVVKKENSGNLKIEMLTYLLQNWKWGKNEPLKVLISFKNLNEISLSSGASACSAIYLKFNNLTINSDDASNSKFELTANKLTLHIKNGSDIRLAGKTSSFIIEATNGCNIKAFELEADSINALLTIGSDAELNASQALHILAKDKSNVHYMATKKLVKRLRSWDYSAIKAVKN